MHIFSDETATSLKSSALAAYLVHAVLLNFKYAYKQWLVRGGHCFISLHLVQCAAERQGGCENFADLKEFFVRALFVCSSWSAWKDSCDKLHL